MKNTISKQYNQVNPFNFIRSISVLCVFLLHVFLFSGKLGFSYNQYTWPLKTPAWSAVWLLLIMSGYFIGKGFFENKYSLDFRGFIKFYLRRLLKVGIPTWIFIFISISIVEPKFVFENPIVIFKVLTFTYYNIPSSDCIGVTWYVSTLMHLYLVAPFICLTIISIKKHIKKHTTLITLMCIILILSMGLIFQLQMLKTGADWSSQVYVPFYANLDLYTCGILLNCFNVPTLRNQAIRFMLGFLSKICLMLGILTNCYISYKADFSQNFLFLYQYILPTVYIIMVSIYILISEISFCPKQQQPLTLQNIIKNPLRLFDVFSEISFEFYLLHSMVISRIYTLFSGNNLFLVHIKIICYSFIITLVWSYILKKIFTVKAKTIMQ